jgi:hypothetical protein
LCHDWAAWDDTYAFIKTVSDDYIESNLAINTFMDSRLNLIYYCDKEGEVVWGEIHELETGNSLDLKGFPKKKIPKTHPLIFLQTGGKPLSELTRAGLIMTKHGPMLISSRPILRINNEGPIRDYIMMGRFLGPDQVKSLCDQTQVNFQLWPILKMQRIALLHIFANILGRAAESIRDAGCLSGEIEIRAKMEPFDGVEMLHVSVQDNGKGIEKQNLEHIFSNRISEKQGSCGQLGLHWCANTVTSMQGKLYVVSDGRGKGATMHLLIPVPHNKSESMEAV